MTKELFCDDSYRQECSALVVALTPEGGIVLDQTIFYPKGGGQLGDCGTLETAGDTLKIETTIKDRETGQIIHIPTAGQILPQLGAQVTAKIDWSSRFALMQMHSALHLLCSIIPHGVTGGQIGIQKSRLDFDVSTKPEPLPEKTHIQAEITRLIAENHPITTQWVDDALLAENPDIVRTLSVTPPTNSSGLLRLVQIGLDDNLIDRQPCGGTHVAHTSEIKSIRVGKIENKGARNRRINVHLEQ